MIFFSFLEQLLHVHFRWNEKCIQIGQLLLKPGNSILKIIEFGICAHASFSGVNGWMGVFSIDGYSMTDSIWYFLFLLRVSFTFYVFNQFNKVELRISYIWVCETMKPLCMAMPRVSTIDAFRPYEIVLSFRSFRRPAIIKEFWVLLDW